MSISSSLCSIGTLIISTLVISSATVGVSLVPSSPANAQEIERYEPPTEGNIQSFSLSDEQTRQILEIRRQANEKLSQYFAQLQQVEAEMNALMNSADASEAEVREKYNEMQMLMQKISEIEFEARLAIRRILPPELRLPFAQKLEESLRESLTQNRTENQP